MFINSTRRKYFFDPDPAPVEQAIPKPVPAPVETVRPALGGAARTGATRRLVDAETRSRLNARQASWWRSS